MTHVKICGIKMIEDGFAAIDAGADYLGFNFYAKSVRYIEPETCRKITTLLRAHYPAVKFVGVFVNTSPHQIKMIKKDCLLDLVQLHGDESPADLTQLGRYAYKAFRGLPDNLDAYITNDAPAFLLDAASTNAYGGTGLKADWSAAAELTNKHAIFLAGGLTPENVADAITQVHPWGVDTASGVESAPGVKDASKMKTFVKMVRQTDQQLQTPLENS